MNILVLTTSYPSARGDLSGNFIHSLARALARRGHCLRVVAPGRAGSFGPREVDGIPIRLFRYALTGRGHALTSTAGGIPEAIRRNRRAALNLPGLMACFAAAAGRHARWADVIYANWLGAGLAGGIVRLVTGAPMVITLRGDDAYLIRDRPLWRTVGRWVFRRCACVTVVSANMAGLLEELVPARARPVIVPTFGVDACTFHPPESPARRERDEVRGLFVGNISRAKGVDVLLGALAKCAEPWRFTFVGAGADLEAMRQLAGRLHLAERVEWLGQRPPGEIPELMRGADFLVLPSRSEGRPNVVLEAMASGLPVVATPVGSVPDLIQDGRTGILVPPGDEEALAHAMARICKDPQLRAELSRQSRLHIEGQHLTWDRTAEEFEAIFRAAVQIVN